MKNKKSFAFLSTGLIGLLALSACAPSQVTPEEGKAILNNMQKAYDAGEVTPSKQIHITATHKISGKMPAGQASADLGYEISVDFNKIQAQMTYQTSGNNIMSAWAYYDNGEFITAIDSSVLKAYSTVAVNEEKAKELLNKFEGVKEEVKETGANAISELKEAIDEFEGFNQKAAVEMFGGKTKASIDAEFRSNKESQLHFYVYTNLENAFIKELATAVNVKSSVEFKVENYILSSMENETTFTGKVLGQDVEYTRSSNLYVDNKAKIKLPNIKDFTKGIVSVPELPFDID